MRNSIRGGREDRTFSHFDQKRLQYGPREILFYLLLIFSIMLPLKAHAGDIATGNYTAVDQGIACSGAVTNAKRHCITLGLLNFSSAKCNCTQAPSPTGMGSPEWQCAALVACEKEK